MNETQLLYFRKKLKDREAELKTLSSGARDARKPVELDQQSVGRLSRQDALQQQAMANAQEARRANELKKIKAALVRIEEGEYGFCVECGEKISERRLEIDLTAAHCAPCAGAVTR
ncbi:TraR/DksA C4-type zinc finger protein [Hyphococcus flavus]|uniref:TraR/DksA C4-type zinc finger protein n=1 Tax=Hyphococcus flavus TaxID=1866326 RepID=A0AAF0CFR9_9PROT|nr:TraR/DksA C4-type zinc finger protein [Hyphococcus flavus]WDI31664.1 TraR/DksA C4-type zinc finger protein [Hyphococcus flavus]